MKTNKIYIAIIIIIAISYQTEMFAQKSLQKARILKDNYEFAQAIDYYLNFFSTNTPTSDHAREIAESYFKINDTKNAEFWMSKVITSNTPKPADILNYAHVLRSNGKYEKAIEQYRKYADLNPTETPKTTKWIDASEKAKLWMLEDTYLKVENADVFNSENADFGLMPFGEGFILTSDRKIKEHSYNSNDIYRWTGKPYLKLIHFYEVDKYNNTAKIKIIEDLNNNFHNGTSAFDELSNTVYFTQTKMVRVRKSPMNTDPTSWIDYTQKSEFISRLEIYFATYNNGSWSDIKPFDHNKVENYSVGHPTISPCGKIMYFSSDMPEGYGGTDIYYSVLGDDGRWSKPQNAGDNINTDGNEVFPYIADNGTLFFSSNGHPGMGGLDIFKSTGAKNMWSIPENLKYPINSPKDDFSILFTETEKKGYFASNRDGGKGDDDIYRFELLPPQHLTVVAITKEMIDNNIHGFLPNVNLNISKSDNSVENLKTNQSGYLYFSSGCNENFTITATKEGYFADHATLSTKCQAYNDTMFVELLLNKYTVGKTFAIKNIFYDFDKWDIRADAKPELDQIVEILLENPQINIELGSHTDSRGTNPYNERLSQRRAESAVAYIISQGINASRITAKGYGENELVNECKDGVRCTDEQHQMNRRTEFKITSLNY